MNNTGKFFSIFASIVVLTLCLLMVCLLVTSCNTKEEFYRTQRITNQLLGNQQTPEDIEYSLERYNLIRRAYWVNGHREKANTLPCEIEKPLGYIVLFSGPTVVGSFIVDGKVTCLNSFLTPDSTSPDGYWLADVDGSYGQNDDGIFFFTPDGKYIEWTGDYLYSDIPFEIDIVAPVVRYYPEGEKLR